MKDVEGFEGKYGITEDGQVWRYPHVFFMSSVKVFCEGKWLKPTKTNLGYLRITIGEKLVFVHRLVAGAYVPKLEGKNCVNHMDGIKTNNHYSNLEWCTVEENLKHAHRTGLIPYKKGRRPGHGRLSPDDVRLLRQMREDGVLLKELAVKFKISVANAWFIASRNAYKDVN